MSLNLKKLKVITSDFNNNSENYFTKEEQAMQSTSKRGTPRDL